MGMKIVMVCLLFLFLIGCGGGSQYAINRTLDSNEVITFKSESGTYQMTGPMHTEENGAVYAMQAMQLGGSSCPPDRTYFGLRGTQSKEFALSLEASDVGNNVVMELTGTVTGANTANGTFRITGVVPTCMSYSSTGTWSAAPDVPKTVN